MKVERKTGLHGKRARSRQVRGWRDLARVTRLPSALGAAWLPFLVATLLAFSWQGFVGQTHHHSGPEIIASAAKAGVANGEKPERRSSDLPVHCAVCRAIAHAGPVLLPAAIALPAPAPQEIWIALADRPAQTRVQRSHAWRSRAPPRPLQA